MNDTALANIRTTQEMHDWIIEHFWKSTDRWTLIESPEWELQHRISSWKWEEIIISPELGEAFYDLWNKEESVWNRRGMRLIGTYTIPGLLERLGDTTIKKILATERKVKEAQTKKIARNNNRMSLARQAKDFVAYLDAHGENVGISSKDVDVSKILDLENQIEP